MSRANHPSSSPPPAAAQLPGAAAGGRSTPLRGRLASAWWSGAGHPPAPPSNELAASAVPVAIRLASAGDEQALARLAALDSQRSLHGPVLVAEVDGALWAALSLRTGATIADPFRRTSDLVALLRERARQLQRAESDAEGVARPRRLRPAAEAPPG